MKPWIPLIALALALSPLTVVHPVRVQGHSMEPTLRNGQIGWALRNWAAGAPALREIWLVDTPDGPAIKRVIALPGEVLELRQGELLRRGRPVDETYVQHPERGNAGPWIAGEGYLVLGDNRPESRDSRAWGPLPRRAFRARLLEWSR